MTHKHFSTVYQRFCYFLTIIQLHFFAILRDYLEIYVAPCYYYYYYYCYYYYYYYHYHYYYYYYYYYLLLFFFNGASLELQATIGRLGNKIFEHATHLLHTHARWSGFWRSV